jgi:hypothetical protein
LEEYAVNKQKITVSCDFSPTPTERRKCAGVVPGTVEIYGFVSDGEHLHDFQFKDDGSGTLCDSADGRAVGSVDKKTGVITFIEELNGDPLFEVNLAVLGTGWISEDWLVAPDNVRHAIEMISQLAPTAADAARMLETFRKISELVDGDVTAKNPAHFVP